MNFDEEIIMFNNASHIATFTGSNSISSIFFNDNTKFILLNMNTNYIFPHSNIVKHFVKNHIILFDHEDVGKKIFTSQKIIDELGDRKKVKVKIGRFQNIRIDETFDLVFTSPPFYTKEVYAHMKVWETVDEFMTEFLRPLLRKSYRLLEDKGHLVLYIEDKGVDSFIPAMKEYAKELGFIYEGAFYYEGYGRPKPYYVWKKI